MSTPAISAPSKPAAAAEEPATPAVDEVPGSPEADPAPAPEGEPEPAAEPAAAPALNAFQRGMLRAMGTSDLVNRVATAEASLAAANETVGRLTAENSRLVAEMTRLQGEHATALDAARKGRAEEVTKGVTQELSTLGLEPENAPSMAAAGTGPEALLEKFEALEGKERIAFFRANRADLKAAEKAKLAAAR